MQKLMYVFILFIAVFLGLDYFGLITEQFALVGVAISLALSLIAWLLSKSTLPKKITLVASIVVICLLLLATIYFVLGTV